jgi:hypothetical protein
LIRYGRIGALHEGQQRGILRLAVVQICAGFSGEVCESGSRRPSAFSCRSVATRCEQVTK